MIKTRLMTAFVLLPVVFVLIQWGGWAFSLVLTLIALVATWEFVHIMTVRGHKPTLLFAFAFVLAALGNMQFPEWQLFVPTCTILLMLMLVWELFQTDSKAQPVDWALTVGGSLYIGLGLGHLLGLRLLPDGHIWVWLAIACTWGADTGAYFGGRAFGKHKFWPRWSPKKTWEGIFAGVFGGMFGGGLVTLVFNFPLTQALIIGILVSVVGPFGDLSISMMKRYAGVKDSSHLLPGHGGVLDRADSVLFASVMVFYYATWMLS